MLELKNVEVKYLNTILKRSRSSLFFNGVISEIPDPRPAVSQVRLHQGALCLDRMIQVMCSPLTQHLSQRDWSKLLMADAKIEIGIMNCRNHLQALCSELSELTSHLGR